MLKDKTREELQDFLRLCLDPGPGRDKRSVAYLAEIMSGRLLDEVFVHAPHLVGLRERAVEAQTAYVEALRTWIADEVGTARADDVARTRTATVTETRADCAVCGQNKRVNRDNRMYPHNGMTAAGFSTGKRCDGAGEPPYVYAEPGPR